MSQLGNVNLKVGIIIPVYNVEKTIGRVMDSISSSIYLEFIEILIIDNKSEDKTLLEIEKNLFQNPILLKKITLIQHKRNYGYGCSIKAGFEYFLNKPVSHLMVIHGDYQVNPACLIGRLIGSVRMNVDTDLVLASRFMKESNVAEYSLLRKLGNYFFNRVTAFTTGHRMSDSGTAMVIVKKDILENLFFRNLSNSWQFHPQLNIILYSIDGIRIREISMDWADSEADSTVPLIRYGLLLLRMLIMYYYKKNILKKDLKAIFSHEPMPLDHEYSLLFFEGKESLHQKGGFDDQVVMKKIKKR